MNPVFAFTRYDIMPNGGEAMDAMIIKLRKLKCKQMHFLSRICYDAKFVVSLLIIRQEQTQQFHFRATFWYTPHQKGYSSLFTAWCGCTDHRVHCLLLLFSVTF